MSVTAIGRGRGSGLGSGTGTSTASGAGVVGPGTWLRRFHPAPQDADTPLLIVLPHAGGSAGNYHSLSAALSGRVEVLAVQYPGRQDRYREELVTDLHTLARGVATALEPLAGRRLALFGHSMGALVAFETVRLLERAGGAAVGESAGGPVTGLFVSARRPPVLPRIERMHESDDAGLLAEMRALGGTDERLLQEAELLRMYLPVVRADYRVVETYRAEPGAAVDVPVTALAGEADPRVSVADMESWSRHTTSGFDLQAFPGGHFYLDGQAGAVADTVVAALD